MNTSIDHQTISPFKPHGRISRFTFIAWHAVMTIVLVSVLALIFQFSPNLVNDILANITSLNSVGIILLLIYIPLFYISIVFTIKRLHDLDQSGWLALLTFVPIANFFFSLYIVLMPGTTGANKFGQQRAPKTWETVLAWIMIAFMCIAIIGAIFV